MSTRTDGFVTQTGPMDDGRTFVRIKEVGATGNTTMGFIAHPNLGSYALAVALMAVETEKKVHCWWTTAGAKRGIAGTLVKFYVSK